MGNELSQVTQLAPAGAAQPTLSETLRKWLEAQKVSPAGTLGDPQPDAVSIPEQIAEITAEYARLAQAGIALNVMQGYLLARAAALGKESLRKVVLTCDVPLASAHRNVELYTLFNELGDLALVQKAETLGPSRIRELKPWFGIDGIRQLIEGTELDGMTYQLAAALPSREITLWVRQRKDELLAKRVAEAGIAPTPAEMVPQEPRPLLVARDDLTGELLRARIELEYAARELELLGADAPEPARSELLHFVAAEAKGIGALAAQLEMACGRATDRNVNAPLGELATLTNDALDALSQRAADEATADLARRATVRQRKHGWKGRPPASLQSVMAHARKTDGAEA